jgi:hypothetical protein
MILSAWRKEMTGDDMSNSDERARSTQRRIGVGLAAMAGAVAAAALTLTATSPAANADTIELPALPSPTGSETGQENLGIAPLFTGSAYEQNGSFTDLLGYHVDTTAPGYLPLDWDTYDVPNSSSPSIEALGVTSPSHDAVITAGDVGGSTYSELAIPVGSLSTGFANIYEDTPFYPSLGIGATDNVSDTFGYFSGATPEFGVQYVDLPDAATPIDELNFFGSGGEILFSIPVTGDLLTMF